MNLIRRLGRFPSARWPPANRTQTSPKTSPGVTQTRMGFSNGTDTHTLQKGQGARAAAGQQCGKRTWVRYLAVFLATVAGRMATSERMGEVWKWIKDWLEDWLQD
jgi:hypothetical protein